MSGRRKRLFAVLGAMLLFIVAFAFLAWSTTNECEKLQEAPTVPIHSPALLLESDIDDPMVHDYSLFASMVGIRSKSRLVSFDYSSDDSAQNIIDFYEAHAADCQENFEESARVVCTGSAIPTGTYSAYFDINSDLRSVTTFTVEVRWFACGLLEEI